MLDLKFVRSNPEKVEEALKNRGGKINLNNFLQIELMSGINSKVEQMSE